MTSVLAFHAVTDGDWFQELIGWLNKRYRLVPLASLATYRSTSAGLDNACHITVDDGDQTFYDVVFPVLRRNRVPASLFVSPKICLQNTSFWFQEIRGYSDEVRLRSIAAAVLSVPPALLKGVGLESVFKAMRLSEMNEVIRRYQEGTGSRARQGQNICANALKEIDESGLVSIGAHTMNHPILMNEDRPTSEYEISASVRALSTLLGHRVTSFAYPNGLPDMDFGMREEEVLTTSGIQLAFTTEARHLSRDDNPLRIPRLAISDKETRRKLCAKLTMGTGLYRLKRVLGRGEAIERRRLYDAISSCRGREPTRSSRAPL